MHDTSTETNSSMLVPGIVATNALELGVDVGALDCTMMLGFPGTMASLWQQSGRSGRKAKDALTIMVPHRVIVMFLLQR